MIDKIMNLYLDFLYSVQVFPYNNDRVCMAVVMNSKTGGRIVPTVNLGSYIEDKIMPKYCAFIDTNNCSMVDIFLEQQGIAKPYKIRGNTVTKRSGHHTYSLYQFDKVKLVDLGADLMLYENEYETTLKKKVKGN